MAQEVQRDALAGQQAARRTHQGGDHVTGGQAAAVRPLYLEPNARIDQPEGKLRQVEPGHHAGLTRHQRHTRNRFGGDDRIARDVAGPTEILQQRRAHQRFDYDRRQRGDGHREHALRIIESER